MNQQMCSETVMDRTRWASSRPCGKTAKVERDGKPYCTVHDPERARLRDASICHERVFSRLCGQPAVEVVHGFGRCAIHTEEAKATSRKLGTHGPALLEALEAVITQGSLFDSFRDSIGKTILEQAIAAIERAKEAK